MAHYVYKVCPACLSTYIVLTERGPYQEFCSRHCKSLAGADNFSFRLQCLIDEKGNSAVIEYYLPQIILRLVKDLRVVGCTNSRVAANLIRKVLYGGEVTDKIDVRYVFHTASQLAEKTEPQPFVMFLERVFRQIQHDATPLSLPLNPNDGDQDETEDPEGSE